MWKLTKNNLFFILYVMYIINQVFSESQFSSISLVNQLLLISRYAILLLLVGFIASNNKSGSKIEFVLLFLVIIFLVINLVFADGGLSILPVMLFVWASQGFSIEKQFKLTMVTLVTTHLFIMLCAKIGIVEDILDYRYIGSYAGSFFSGMYARHNMGFLVHNQIALAFLIVYLMYIAYKKDKIRWYENLVIMILNYIVFSFFGSRIVFILTLGTCISYYLVKATGKIRTHSGKSFSFLIFPVGLIASFIAALTYKDSNRVSLALDLFLNNRLRLAKEAIDFYGIGIIGAGQYAGTYNSTTLANNTVDNGYISIFLQNGLVVALIVIGVWTYLTYLSGKKKNKYLTMVFVMLAIENIVNYHLASYKMLPFFCMLLNCNDPFLEGKMMCQNRRSKRIALKKLKVRRV